MDLVELVAELDTNAELHSARLLVLLLAFDGTDSNPIEGLTKLAKLDFLLRYPAMLERAVIAKGKSAHEIRLLEHEKKSVESAMVRYRFGPWDHRYREFLNILIAKNLVVISIEGRKVVISLSMSGRETALRLAETDEFQDYVRRSAVLKRHFDVQATTLMRFIYETFPEVVSLRSNEKISP